MAGAELLAAGLLGGAAILLLERSAGQMHRLLQRARDIEQQHG
jgi:hypothetical protein